MTTDTPIPDSETSHDEAIPHSEIRIPHSLTPQQVFRRKASGEPVHEGEEHVVRRHVVTVLLNNHIGALNRVTNLFSARGFNLESVTVGETDDPEVSRMTLVTSGVQKKVGQVVHQLVALIDVLEVEDVSEEPHVERELCLVRVGYSASTRAELMDVLGIFRGKVIDISPESMAFELSGPTTKIDAFVGMLRPHGIAEIARSGRIAMRRDAAFSG
jgi:acetolactate synthase-1/3 small subunit